jgi:hypothetical protein
LAWKLHQEFAARDLALDAVKTSNLVAAGAQGLSSERSRGWMPMSQHDFPRLRVVLETRIRARTGGRLRDLDIELSPEGIVLRGHTSTFYVKQLAQHGIRDVLPDVRLQNAIDVA